MLVNEFCGAGPSLTVYDALAVQPPVLVVTVTVYVPAERPVKSSVVAPLLQANVKGVGEPPVVVKLMAPFEPPRQETLVTDPDKVGAVHVGAFNTGFVKVLFIVMVPIQFVAGLPTTPLMHKGRLVLLKYTFTPVRVLDVLDNTLMEMLGCSTANGMELIIRKRPIRVPPEKGFKTPVAMMDPLPAPGAAGEAMRICEGLFVVLMVFCS